MERPAGNDTEKNKGQAQERADRIRVFRDELEQLEREGVLIFSGDQLRELNRHHDKIIEDLAGRFDVDTTAAEKQMSWGMRIASFVGALAFSAAVFSFFYRFWGLLSTPVQVGILVGAPILAVLAMKLAARKERTLYIASLIGLVAIACFVLDISVLGKIFNIKPTQYAFLAWGTFGLVLAYTFGLRLLLAAGLLLFLAFLPAEVASWSGTHWFFFGDRPENFLPASLLLFLVPLVFSHRRCQGFPGLYRLFGSLVTFIPILFLANWGEASYLMLPGDRIEVLYQILGFLLGGLGIWIGIRQQWIGMTNLSVTFFAVLLFMKFFDWWWDWMPKYLFFLILGMFAIGLLLLLNRLRARRQRTIS